MNPGRAEIVREIFSRYLSEQSQYHISKWLEAEGQKGRLLGGRWSTPLVGRILDNPAYASMCIVDGEKYTATRGIGVAELATLWNIAAIQEHFRAGTRGVPFLRTLNVLRSASGPLEESLAEAFHWFPWRKGHWSVRALLQNSAVLNDQQYSFRA